MKNAIFFSIFFLISAIAFAGNTEKTTDYENAAAACHTNPCMTVICPADITLSCIEDFLNDPTLAQVSSSCGTIVSQWITNPQQSGLPNCPGSTYIFTYKAVDDTGEVGCCDQLVTIDNAAPAITVSPGTTVTCYTDIEVDPSDASVTTSCGEDLEVTIYPPVLSGPLDCPGTTYTFTYRVNDQCEREATADRVFTNGDNDPPVVQAPDDTTCECLAGINPNPDHAVVTTGCNYGYTTTVSGPIVQGPMDCTGTSYTYTYTTTDDCGRTSEDQQTFTITSGPPILLNCPENCLTLNCTDDTEAIIQAWLATVTATTFCGAPLTVTNDYDPNSFGVCIGDPMTTVTWTATDACGQTSTCTGDILVIDTDPPIIVEPAQDEFRICNTDIPTAFDNWINAHGYAIAIDECWDDLFWTTDPANPIWDIDGCGELEVTFIVIDGCGNSASTSATFSVLDPIGPDFFEQPKDTIVECGSAYTLDDWLNTNGGGEATDNCGPVTITTDTIEIIDGCGETGSTKVVFIAEDDCGNSTASDTVSYIIIDTNPPTFTFVPADYSIECGEIPVFGDATAEDNCGMVTLGFVDATIGDQCAGGTATRTWTATDECGNSNMAVQTITILPDAENPIFTFVPADYSVECNELPVFGDATAEDNCGMVTLEFVDATTGDQCAGGTATRTWTATDECGNSSIAVQTITLLPDMENPMFTFVPADYSVECNELPVFGDATAEDNCGMVTLEFVDATTGDQCAGGTATRTWTATDECGNSSIAVQTITLLPDMENPMFTFVPDDYSVECNETPVFGDATAEDNCGMVTLEFVDATTGDQCAGGTATRTWTATDECGNSSIAVQTITLLPDMENPMFTFVPDDYSVECNEMPVFGDVTAEDNCGMVTLEFVDATTGDQCVGGTATRTWTATDECGNSSIAVQTITLLPDMENPMFTFVPADYSVECNELPVFGDATAEDNCGMVTLEFVDATTGDQCTGGTATRTWTATDECGNSSIAVQTITLLPDMENPMFTFVPADYSVECNELPVFGDATAEDNCGMVTLEFVDATTGDQCTGGTATRTWTATDECGNSSIAVQTITLLPDMENPMFTFVPDDYSVECNETPVFGDATAEDNCGMVTLEFVDATTGDQCAGGTATRTWTATDECGNSSIAVQTITLLPDMENPMFTFVPADYSVECNETPVFGDATAEDNCGMVTLEFVDAMTGDQCAGGTATRTWTATDECGNSSIAVQTITLLPDMENPMFTFVPDDITIACGLDIVFGSATAEDNCGNVVIVFNDQTTGDVCSGGSSTRTWTATDDCGNTAMADQTITFEPDMGAPVITGVPADTTVECDAVPAPANPMAVDDCDPMPQLEFEESQSGPCANTYTLTRTWTARDHCNNSSMATQVIMVEDTQAPVLTCEDTTILTIQNIGICELSTSLQPIASDNCTATDGLDISYTIDFGNDTTIDDSGVTSSGIFLNVSYPIGTNVVTFTTEDECGNVSTCVSVVIVIDPVPPAFFCNPVTDTLSLVDTTACISAEELIFPPFFECCLDSIRFELPGPTYVETLCFDCDDVDPDGIPVEVRAFDCYGNSSSCETLVFIVVNSKNSTMCDTVFLTSTAISGLIATDDGDEIAEVNIDLNDGAAGVTTTSATGHYEFPDIPTGDNYVVNPYLNTDHANGVSTFDLVQITKHILELDPIDSPYDLIAADANRSGNISTLDIVEIRKLILGIIPEFQNNTSWRFVDAAFQFPNPENPFDSSFPEYCSFNGLMDEISDVNFVGIKIGDVNGSATTNFTNGDSEDRLGGSDVIFKTMERKVAAEEHFSVMVRAQDFKEILGFQFSLEFDPSALSYRGFEKGRLTSLNANNFGYHLMNEGWITCSWHANDHFSVQDGEVLFELKFKAKKEGLISELLSLNSGITHAEAYRHTQQPSDLKLIFDHSTKEEMNSDKKELKLYPNRPNPFKEETVISFYLEREGKGTISVFDATRKLVFRKEGEFVHGYNELIIRDEDLPNSGVFYYQIRTRKGIEGSTMVFIKN